MVKTAVLMYTLTEYLTVKNALFHFLEGVGAQFLIKSQKLLAQADSICLGNEAFSVEFFWFICGRLEGGARNMAVCLVSLIPINFSFLFISLHFNILRKIGFISGSVYFCG